MAQHRGEPTVTVGREYYVKVSAAEKRLEQVKEYLSFMGHRDADSMTAQEVKDLDKVAADLAKLVKYIKGCN